MNAPAAPLSGRLFSLDAYRGFIMLAMVSAGLGTAQLRKEAKEQAAAHPDEAKWSYLYQVANQLEHVDWEGCTFWDLIQPSFMFMVGVSMPFAFAKRRERGESWSRQFRHVLKRCLLLCLIGILMDTFSRQIISIQFIRVLQQIALGYFIAFFFVNLGWKWQLAGVVLLLAGHNLAFYWYGDWHSDVWDYAKKQNNVGWTLDDRMHNRFREILLPQFPDSQAWLNKYFDILPPSVSRVGYYATINFVSSAATILIGVLVGGLLRSSCSAGLKCLTLLLAGAALFSSGYFLDREHVQTMVKHLWNTSFALYAAGWTCWMLLFFYLIIDVLGWRGWAFPFVVVGVNSIFIYFCSGVLVGTVKKLLNPFFCGALDDNKPWGQDVYVWAPVVQHTLVLLVLWLLCLFLYRHRIFFKV